MRERILNLKIVFLAILLMCYLTIPIHNVEGADIYEGSEILPIDGFVSELEEWQEVGAYPWLDKDDNETAYIWNDQSDDDHKYFTFQDVEYTVKIDSVFFYVKYWDKIGNQYIRVTFWYYVAEGEWTWGEMWDVNIPASTWTLKNHNFTHRANTTDQINGLRVWFDSYESNMMRNITYAYFNVTGLMQKPRTYHIRHLIGLLGLTIMIATPTYVIWEVKRNKNYMALATALILFAIGYAFILVWLTP